MKVIGIVEKKGTYENNDYHNVMLHCTENDENALGELTQIVKVKFGRIAEIFGHQMAQGDWEALLGEEILVGYNKFGNVQSVSLRS